MTTHPLPTDDTVLVWIIEPHANKDYDECWLPAGPELVKERRAQEALAYAKDRLEDLWDSAEEGSGPQTVSIELRRVPRAEAEEAMQGD